MSAGVKPKLQYNSLDDALSGRISDAEFKRELYLSGSPKGNRLAALFNVAAAAVTAGALFIPGLAETAVAVQLLVFSGSAATAAMRAEKDRRVEDGKSTTFRQTERMMKEEIDGLAGKYDIGSARELKDSVESYGRNLRAICDSIPGNIKTKAVIAGLSVVSVFAAAALAPALVPVVAATGAIALNAQTIAYNMQNADRAERAERIARRFTEPVI